MKKLLLLAMSLLLASPLFAGPVDSDEAQSKALDFLQGRTSASARLGRSARLQDLSLAISNEAYYVFNVNENNGFVIVSGSDLTPEIIGYADEGAFDGKNMPANLQAWLQGYADQIAWMEAHGEEAAQVKSQRSSYAVKASISPIMTTLWNQDEPYNYGCPANGTEYCATGCLATAMAQVLYSIHKTTGFPVGTTKDIPGYTKGGKDVLTCPAIASFDWNNMQDVYTGSEATTDVTAQAVSTLMRYCGAAVGMTYGSSSGALMLDVVPALNEYFGCNGKPQYLYRTNYTWSEWEDLVYGELEAGRPVLMGATSTGGGHAFVCDGCGEDGYYHINWGWGGKANGYFLLQVLTPSESGIGGSSTYDGFTMQQEMVIGIGPEVVEETPRLTVMEFTYSGSATLSKASSVGITFSRIQIANIQHTSQTFDIALALFDEEGNMLSVGQSTSLEVNNQGIRSSSGTFSANFSAIETGKNYKLKVVSRKNGTSEWLECYGADDCCLLLEGGASNVTVLGSTTYNLSVSDVQLITDGQVGTLQTVQATITNSGNGAFKGDVLMLMNGNQQLAGRGVQVPANGSVTTTFTFKPTWTGSKTLTFGRTLLTGGFMTISGSGSITISGEATSPTLDFSIALNLSEGSPQYILGNEAVATVTITNNNAEAYVGDFGVAFFEEGQSQASFSNQAIYVAPHSTITKAVTKAVEIGKKYSATVVYYPNKSQAQGPSTGYYEARAAISIYQADGTKTMRLPSANVAVPANATVVDLRGQSTVTSIAPNGNPNCLYLLDASAATPSGIADNVVKGDVAANITLTDDGVHGFYSPISFTAQKISYTRTFDRGLQADYSGWNTILLPFDVATVKVGDEVIDWFHSDSEKGKDFWVYGFVTDEGNVVKFAHTDEMKANVPYVIAVPSDAWGSQFDLTNKAITFESTNVAISCNAMSVLNGSNYVFKGIALPQTLNDVYVLNDAGSVFSNQTSADVAPFRAYFVASERTVLAQALSFAFIGDDEAEATGIPMLDVKAGRAQKKGNAIYNMQGMQVGTIEQWKSLPKGVYMVNGNKMFKR